MAADQYIAALAPGPDAMYTTLMRFPALFVLLLACNQSSGEKPSSPDKKVKVEPARPEPPAAIAEPGQPIPSFQADATRFAADGAPTAVKIASGNTERPTAYVFVGTHCGTTAQYLSRIAALEQSYQGKVDFVYLYPNKTDKPEEKVAFHKQHKLRGPMVDDQGAAIASGLLGGERTAELVLAGKDGVIVYRGAIDDNKDESKVSRKHVAVAIDEHLAGKPVSEPKTLGSA